MKPLWEVFVEPRTTEYSSPEAWVPSPITATPCNHATSTAQSLLCEGRTHSGGKPLEKGYSRLRAFVCSVPSSFLTSPVPGNVNRSNRGNLSPTCLHCSKLKTHRILMAGDVKARSIPFWAGGLVQSTRNCLLSVIGDLQGSIKPGVQLSTLRRQRSRVSLRINCSEHRGAHRGGAELNRKHSQCLPSCPRPQTPPHSIPMSPPQT